MTDYRSEPGVGARIKLARRQRGYRTTRELADAIPGGNVTAAVLENIESGRKADISVSQLLNIARGLGVPPSMLLAPIGSPSSELDLPNLSDQFNGMTAAEFDCWLSATPASSYKPRLAAERVDTDVLNSLRELGTLRRELERLRMVLDVQSASGDPDLLGSSDDVRNRIDRVTSEASRVAGLLVNAGISDGSDNAS
ncbi:helix-turn-helix domain-containing protein [Leifsonia sp. NPDC058292]|uniref:helix-turn-helix domain-containing protein n=1 Tax=Leifsonia sp. NPDC058292 TaxID=3346428 RepID=UPI0036D8C65E